MASTFLHRLLQMVDFQENYDHQYNTSFDGSALDSLNHNVFATFNNTNATELMDGVANAMTDTTTSTTTPHAFDPKVFWSVNAFILVLFVSTVTWCCWGSDKSFFSMNPEERRRRSDEIYRRRRLEQRQQEEAAKQETPAQRTKKLLKSFVQNKVQMTVKAEDLVEEDPYDTVKLESDNSSDDENDIETGSMEDCGQLKLANGNLVPNCCAICLTSYEEGDTVIWSSNTACAHAFHQDCVVGWLVKMQPETPCPCCRQEFTDLENVRKESKVKWSPGNAFNIGAVSLR